MCLICPTSLPSVRELQLQPCAEVFPPGKRFDFDIQYVYPSPSMSRRSSFKDDVSHADQASVSTTANAASAMTASALLPTPAPSQQSRGFIQQFHPYSLQSDTFPESQQRPQVQSRPSIGPHTDYNPSHSRGQTLPSYVIPPRTSSLNFSRPTRKSKQHVQSACVNCKVAHLSCDDQRPCQRCERRNLESTCVDVPHRKRGRPRIREQIPNEAAPFALDRRRQSSTTGRVQRSTDEKPTISPLSSTPTSGGAEHFSHPRTPAQDPGSNPPVAFLDMDFRIVRTNKAFQDMFDFLGDLQGQSLDHLVDSTAEDSLSALRSIRTSQLHEKDEKNPAYLPPIRTPGNEATVDIPPVNSQDLRTICRGYTTSHRTLQLRSKESKSRAMSVELCLARSAVIFVVLKVSLLQSPQRPSQAASSAASNSPRDLERRKQSNVSVSRLPDPQRLPTSVHSSPSKSTTSHPPPISPISPVSRPPYQHVPGTSAGPSMQAGQAFYSFPYDPSGQTYHSRRVPGPQPPRSRPERHQPSAPAYLPGPTLTQPYQPYPTVDHLKLPPITTLGTSSSTRHLRTRSASFADTVAMDQSRQQSSHEEQAQQRSADRQRREEGQDESPADSSVQHQTRKRKRGLDVSDLTR